MRSAYRSWWSKEILIRFMNIYMERFGMPTHVGKYPRGTRKEDRDELRDTLERVQAKYSIVIPEDISVDLLQAGTGGESGFRSAIEMHNKFIARSALVPDLIGFTEISGGGSYALGKKHFDVFLWILKQLGRETEESIVGEQLIRPLVDLNYGKVDRYPKFQFESITEEGTTAKSQIVAMGVANGYINPKEEWIRSYLSLPKVEPGTELGVPEGAQLPGTGAEPAGGPEEIPSGDAALDPQTGEPEDPKALMSEVARYRNRLKKLYPAFVNTKGRRSFISVSQPKVQPTKFDQKVDFVSSKNSLEDYRKDTVKALSTVVTRQKEALFDELRRKDLIRKGSPRDVMKLQLKYAGDFKREFERRLFKLYLDSKLKSLFELARGGVPVKVTTKFAAAFVQPWPPLPPQEAIDFFNRKVLAKIVKKGGKEVLLDLATKKELGYYSSKAFAIAGIERDYILQEAKKILLEGLGAADVRSTEFQLEQLFDEYLSTGEIVDGDLLKPYRLEAIVRTNESEALNRGRKSIFTDPDVSSFVPYWQYSVILDDRVRPSHERMHGRVYRSSDPIWDEISPPNGFNCRCLITPITSIEVDRGGGVLISRDPLPIDFPDERFRKFSLEVEEKVNQAQAEDQPSVSVGIDYAKSPTLQHKSIEWVLGQSGKRHRVVKTERLVPSEETALLKELSGKIALQEGQLAKLVEMLKVSTTSNKEVQNLQAQAQKLQQEVADLRQERELEKLAQMAGSPPGQQLGYEWVTRCPYRACGSQNVRPLRAMPGAFVYRCDDCNHLFKVLQDGDVYFFDVGKEEWSNGELGSKPSYFVVDLQGVKYYFATEIERTRRVQRLQELGGLGEIKLYEMEAVDE